jgi:AAA domain-containing protein
VVGIPVKPFYQQYMNAYGTVTKARTKRMYDAFVHLPVEFEMNPDGHRPVSEEYRRVCDRLLLETLDELAIPYWVVTGTVGERVARIVELFDLPVVVPLAEAVEAAAARMRRGKEAVAERQIVSQVRKSVWRRASYAVRY